MKINRPTQWVSFVLILAMCTGIAGLCWCLSEFGVPALAHEIPRPTALVPPIDNSANESHALDRGQERLVDAQITHELASVVANEKSTWGIPETVSQGVARLERNQATRAAKISATPWDQLSTDARLQLLASKLPIVFGVAAAACFFGQRRH